MRAWFCSIKFSGNLLIWLCELQVPEQQLSGSPGDDTPQRIKGKGSTYSKKHTSQ